MLKFPAFRYTLFFVIFWCFAITANGQKAILDKIETDHPFTVDHSDQYFGQDVQYIRTGFYGTTDFSNADFNGQVQFIDCYLKKMLDFSGATFHEAIDLSRTTFKTGADFSQARLPRLLILSNLNLRDCKGKIDLTNIKPVGICHINLLYTNISKIALDYSHFKLFFPEDARGREVFIEAMIPVYKGLLRQQKQLGFANGYHKLAKEFARNYPKEYDEFLADETTPPPVIDTKGFGKAKSKSIEDIVATIIRTQEAQERSFKKKQRIRIEKNVVAIGLILSLVIFTVRHSLKSYVAGRKVSYQTQVVTSSPNYFKQKTVPLREIQKTVSKGQVLWGGYLPPKDILEESEEFWEKYENLLEKAKT
ncbi:hypothetical protein BKI52_08625 [marine bacterium AO1-C]|nr:hypothetical protein BKI52_08625 [marine bacterium AO1-C]